MVTKTKEAQGVTLAGPVTGEAKSILTPEALEFVVALQRRFGPGRDAILASRVGRQKRLDAGETPDFLKDTADVRQADWKVASIPKDLNDRRVEITGPVDRKMIINALNSGAKVFMADFEDSHAPGWQATLEGQVNLRDAINGTIAFTSPEGKKYALNPQIATLMVRPRGWHLPERHVLVDGKPMSGSLFDFGLFFFHNAKTLIKKGSGPYFYLPKLESHVEARLWNDVFVFAQETLGIPRGTIRATVLIETILAAFEMDEILFELKEHSAGLNCGRWDYIFSYIKKFGSREGFVLPDRSQVTMGTHFLRSYSLLLIKTCHRRGAHAMGGMAAQIPIKTDPDANAKAIEKVVADKVREVENGHDGTWVAHPGLVPVAMKVFDEKMKGPNQIDRKREEVTVVAKDLLEAPHGEFTEHGLRTNLTVGVQYLEAWLRGIGCVPLYNLMEDAATSEISRAQVWQWLHQGVTLREGQTVTRELVQQFLNEEMAKLQGKPKLAQAATLFMDMITAKEFVPFLTLPAYEHLD